MDYRQIGEKIKERRKMLMLTQADLSKKTGLSPRRISEIETGRVENISLNTMCLLSKVLCCSIGDLLDEEESERDTAKYKSEASHRNYLHIDPYYGISTFAQLVLILPLIRLKNMYMSLERIDGHVFNREDYVSQQFDWCLRSVPDGKAKQFVEEALEMIKNRPWQGRDDKLPTETLEEEFTKRLMTDPQFQECFNEYIALIKEKHAALKEIDAFFGIDRDVLKQI